MEVLPLENSAITSCSFWDVLAFYLHPDSVQETKKNKKPTSFSHMSTFAGGGFPLVTASATPAGNFSTKET